MNKPRLLRAEEISVRAQSVVDAKSGVGAVLLLYKDARADMQILDETFGISGWQRKHDVVNGNLFCSVSVWDEEKAQWIEKQDVGTESDAEAEKGQASDAFKRACVNFGIGRELYTGPFIWVSLRDGETYNDKGKLKLSKSVKFSVGKIEYDGNDKISVLEIIDKNGDVRYSLNGKKPTPKPEPKPAPKSNALKCQMCAGDIVGDGKRTAQQIAEGTERETGKPCCIPCFKFWQAQQRNNS